MNQFMCIGNICNDLELRETSGGRKVLDFTVAVSSGKDNPSVFVPCTAWESQAEFIAKYFSKGRKIGIVARFMSSLYETKEGEKRNKYSFVINKVDFCDSKKDSSVSDDEPVIDTPNPKTDKNQEVSDEEMPF